MIAMLLDIGDDRLEEIVSGFLLEGASNLNPWPAGTLPDPFMQAPGIYRQPDGSWSVIALLPDPGTGPITLPPPPVVVPPTPAPDFPIAVADPDLTVESPAVFTIYTDLKRTVSTLTAASIDGYFAAQPEEHRALTGIGQPVIDAAKKYAINASYIVAHAILESGWGTSRIANTKHNLFGWNAFDTRPDLAKGFDDYAECIDFVMGRVNALYLISTGRYFEDRPCVGNLSTGMNAHYATEADWGTSIAAIAQHMGRKIDGAAGGPPVIAAGPTTKKRGTRAEFVVDHKISGNVLQIPHGIFTVFADDGTVIASMEANTGGFVSTYGKTNGPTPPGTYRIDDYRSPRNDEGTAMRYFDVSFSFSLTPINGTNVCGRSGLDIHPDGPPPGTHGCIGLVAQTRSQLEDMRDLLRAHTTGGSYLDVTVSYTATSGVS